VILSNRGLLKGGALRRGFLILLIEESIIELRIDIKDSYSRKLGNLFLYRVE